MGVTAEDPIGAVMPGVLQSSGRYFRRHAKPARIEPVDEARDRLAFEIEFLQLQIQRGPQATQSQAVDLKSIELVSVDCNVFQAMVVPGVSLVNPDADQMGHDVRQAVVVITLHPDDFNIPLGVRELADASQKLPVIFGEAGEIEIGKNVAEQDQALEAGFLQHASGLARMARVCTEMQVGEDQRVVHVRIHI
jgi:hypothetical protein